MEDRAALSWGDAAQGPEPCAAGGGPSADRRDSLLLAGPARLDSLAPLAEALGLRLLGRATLAELGDRLSRTILLNHLLLDLRDASPAEIEAAARALRMQERIGAPRRIILTDLAGLDAVAARLDGPGAELLCEPDAADILAALLAGSGGNGSQAALHDIGREGDSQRLERLSEEVRRLAVTIERLAIGGAGSAGEDGLGSLLADRRRGYRGEAGGLSSAAQSAAAGPHDPVPVEAAPPSQAEVRAILRARRLRDQFLPADLFADPAWDMMLDLMAARLAGKRVSVSSLCIAASVPPTTALRWIRQLTERGIFARIDDPADGRRVFIELTAAAADAVADWARTVRGNGGLLCVARPG